MKSFTYRAAENTVIFVSLSLGVAGRTPGPLSVVVAPAEASTLTPETLDAGRCDLIVNCAPVLAAARDCACRWSPGSDE